MDVLGQIAEARIRDALARGDFDDLPMRGTPLKLEDLSRMEPSLRAGYLLLRSQGYAFEELGLRKDILRLEDLFAACRDGPAVDDLRADLARARLRFELLVDRRADTAALEYEERILDRLSRESRSSDDG